MHGIKRRLVGSYLIIILLTVFLFEMLMFIAIRQYYVGNIRESLQSAAEVSASFHNQYLTNGDLQERADYLIRTFSETTNAQVQILDAAGKVIADSTGMSWGKTIDTADVRNALAGKPGEWRGNMPETGEPVLSIAYPLLFDTKNAGALRLVTSLAEAEAVIQRIFLFLLVAGIAILIISVIVSLLLSRTITEPVRQITRGAEEMAAGNFTVRIPKQHNDELGMLSDTLHYMAEEIMRHEKVKNQFVASVSHELRTPLTSIKGWTITLLNGTVENKELREGLEIINKETDRLTAMVEELLDFSRLGAGKITLRPTTFPLYEWLHQIVKQVSLRAERQNIELSLEVGNSIRLLSGDPDRLKQVVLNLIDNALKFTHSGGIISISAVKKHEHILLSVQDNGEGIASEHLPYVTRKFYKANPAAQGSGLGLAICKEIIALHGGTMKISSAAGHGTKVDVTLPLSTTLRKDEMSYV